MLIQYKDKIIGKLECEDGNCVFSKSVNPLVHRLRILDAYGIQKVAFDDELRGRKGRVVIKEKGGRRLESSIKCWEEKGIVRDFGGGPQVFLPIKYMQDSNSKQKRLL